MTDNVQPVKDNQQIRFTGLKSVGDQRRQENLANKQPKRKIQNKKQEMNVQNDTVEDATPFVANKPAKKIGESDNLLVGADRDEQPKNGSGSIIDLEI